MAKRIAPHIEARRVEVAKLMAKRVTVARMQAILGVSRETILSDTRALREEWAISRPDIVNEVMTDDLIRLAELEKVQVAAALDPDNRGNGFATDRVLAIMQRRSALLGLDAPAKAKVLDWRVDVSSLSDEQLERISNGDDPFTVLFDPQRPKAARGSGGGTAAAGTDA